MKTFLISLAVVLILGGGVWYMLETGQEDEVFDREEALQEDFLEMTMEEEEFMEILSRATNVSSLSYDVEMESPTDFIEGSFWQKGDRIRMEGEVMGEETLVIIDNRERVAYTYLPAQEMAVKVSLSEVEEVQEGSLQNQADELPEYNPVVIGKETLDGKECLVVEYDINDGTGKMWIWKEHGLPIKFQAENMTVRAFNIDFGDISDDKFQLPEGVDPMEVPTDVPFEVPEETLDEIPDDIIDELPEGISF